MSVELYCKLI